MPFGNHLKQFVRDNYPDVKASCPLDISCPSFNTYCQKFAKACGFANFEAMRKETSVPVMVDALNQLYDELRLEGIDVERTLMQLKWPQHIIFSSLELASLFDDQLKKVEHRVPYTHHARQYVPMMQPNGDATWHIDVEVINKSQSIINLEWFENVLGKQHVRIVKGRNLYMEHLRRHSEAGDHSATHALAVRAIHKQEYVQAIKLLHKAVELGCVDAHFELGFIYEYGLGVDADPARALEHYLQAATQNNNMALNALGHFYGKAGSLGPDFELSFNYHLRAARAGNYDSVGNVGSMLYFGLGVKEDKQEAEKYFAMGDEVSDGCSRNSIAYAEFVKALDSDDFTVALAALEKAAEVKDVEALRNLGIFLLDGYTGVYEPIRGCSLLEEAAILGDAEAMYRLGSYLFYGKNVEQDHEKSAYWFHKAFGMGHGPAINKLAECFWEGLGVNVDISIANQLFETAGKYREPRGYANLATSYLYGRGIEKNEEQAFKYMLMAAHGGYKFAMERVANFYLSGIGVEIDVDKSAEWSEKAASTPEFIPYQWVDPRLIDYISPDYLEPIYKERT